jgi:hypothetical protein
MKSKVNTLLSILVLVFFIPATLGFTLINHHCNGCQSNDKETVILMAVHHHDDASCFCTGSSDSEEKHSCEHHTGDSHGEDAPVKHTHDCVVQLKKLETPFTPVSFDDWLPLPLEITFATRYFVQDQIPPESFSVHTAFLTFSPPRIQTGYERLIMNEVFRL